MDLSALPAITHCISVTGKTYITFAYSGFLSFIYFSPTGLLEKKKKSAEGEIYVSLWNGAILEASLAFKLPKLSVPPIVCGNMVIAGAVKDLA